MMPTKSSWEREQLTYVNFSHFWGAGLRERYHQLDMGGHFFLLQMLLSLSLENERTINVYCQLIY